MMHQLSQLSEGHKVVLFMGYVAVIYACHLTAAVFEEKIYKVPYPSNAPSGSAELFTDNITPYSFTSAVSCLIGYLLIRDEELTFHIPVPRLLKIATSDVLIHVALIAAMMRTDYTTMVVANSSSLLSVVLVGAFCSGVRHASTEEGEAQGQIQGSGRDKIGAEKIWICLVVFLGVLIFALGAPAKDAEQKSSGAAFTFVLFAVVILLQGFRPDFVAQVKQEYEPSPTFLYFSVSMLVAGLTLGLSVVTWKVGYFVEFVLSHERLLVDLTAYAVLNALGALFAFKTMAIFRQHIYPLVAEVRRCLTICVNVLWYGHTLAALQWLGILTVFAGILLEVAHNYNLASRLLPNHNTRTRHGQNYNKIVPKDEPELHSSRYATRAHDLPEIGHDVEGI